MIEVMNLKKRFTTAVALDGVSFTVKEGEVLGFLGPNGAGKTTTLRIITGFLFPDEGAVKIGEFDVLENPMETKKRIGYLPEDNPIYMDLRVNEFLNFVAEIRGLSGVEKRNAIERVVETVGLQYHFKKTIETLSRGYRQRVGLAQALIHDPDILILDEPTTGLDPTQIVEIRKLIKGLGREKTILLSTHILPEVQAVASRVVIINRGKIAASGTLDDLTKGAAEGETTYIELKAEPTEVEREFESAPWIETYQRVGEHDGYYRWAVRGHNGADIRESLFKLVIEKGWTLLELWRERATLEEVFLQLTTEE